MKRTTIAFSAVFLLVLFGTLTFAQEPSEQAKPQKQEEQKSERAKPSKQEEPKAAKPEESKPSKEEPKSSKHENAKPTHEGSDQKAAQEQRGHAAGKGGHIPDNKFRASFSRSHTFVISRPVIVDNQPRFQYAGYWFEIVDPWPEDWAYTDECYIDYIDGDYFLFDLLHPGEQVQVLVVM